MIVAVRHGPVLNPENVVYAKLPGFHLSEQGRADTARLAGSIANCAVAAVYTSPLDRAVETATILAEPHGLSVTVEDRLLEWSFWEHWQGLPWSRIRDRDPEVLAAYAGDPASACPDDPLEEVGGRVLSWAGDAEAAHGGGGLVLGVSHEAPLIAAMLVGSGLGVASFHTMNLPHLATVRLRPGPPEMVDLVGWAARAGR